MKRHPSFSVVLRSLPLLAFLFMSVGNPALADEEALKAGDEIPDVVLKTDAGEDFNLREQVAEQQAVLIFYRGGWCIYCTTQLAGLVQIEEDLKEAGFQLLAISPDSPEKLVETPDRDELGYQLLSDSSMRAAKAFGIAFQVEASLVETYREEYDIDLEAASGEDHHLLPHPAVYVVDSEGVIRFAHIDPNYRERLDPEAIVNAAKAVE